MLDILSIGDCTVDVFLNIEEGQVHCNLQKTNCQICFNYGDKIPVKEVIQIPGTGNAANLAIGARRLGLSSAINAIIGDQGVGDSIIKNFHREKVITKYLIQDDKFSTNYSAIINFQGERTIFSHHENRHYIFPKIKQPPKWIYLTSVGQNYEKLYLQTVKYCQKNNVKLGFNPGSLQVRDGYQKIKHVIDQSNVILINKEEAQTILDSNIQDIKVLLRHFFDLGPDYVVITDGQNGAYSYNGQELIHIPATATKAIERTGAGDAFATGYISAILHGLSQHQALIWGTMNSDNVIQYIGPQKGLLSLTQMRRKIKKYSPKINII
ncbi:MAG TPA: carbohydrate kinase family protein [bacterium]|nr:carbohydrate kinase family protein [bacterium]